MRGDLIETFKIGNEISNYGRYFFNISPQSGNLLSKQISKTKSTHQLDFFVNWVIHFGNKIFNQASNNNSVEIFLIKLDGFRKIGKKKNLRRFF